MRYVIRQEKARHKRKWRGLRPAAKIGLSFLTLILLGSFLLALPFSNKDGSWLSYGDALFTATSAVCVTGLSTVHTASQFSLAGQVFLLLLIQIGGLGFMTLSSVLLVAVGKRISMSERVTLGEAMGSSGMGGLLRSARGVVRLTLCIEGAGALLLSLSFVPRFGAKGLFYAVFHAVSAFCNAGFDLFQTGLVPFQTDVIVSLSLCALIILGGLGFGIMLQILFKKGRNKLTSHAKIALCVTLSLTIGSTILFLLLEYNNVATVGHLNFWQKLLCSFFQSVTPRTAGFATIEQANLTVGSKILTMINMFIGAAPGSTGGGIKTTTFFLIVVTLISSMTRPEEPISVKGRQINSSFSRRAVAVSVFTLALCVLSTFLLSIIEQGKADMTMEALLFESISAISTVGLSYGITPHFSLASKLILCLLMYVGRLGSTMFLFMFTRRSRGSVGIRYPDLKIDIG